jgi:hypothetical protein
MHLGKGFLHFKTVFPEQDDDFRLRVITGVMIGQEMDSFAVVCPETRSVIGDALPDEQVGEPFEDPYPDPPGRRRFKTVVLLSEPGTYSDIGLIIHYYGQQLMDFFRAMLSIAVELKCKIITFIPGITESGLDTSSDS